MNNFLKFYGRNNISPVSQNVDDLPRHVYRREALYRCLGLPRLCFKDKEILEVGPGSGFNSFVTATFEPRRYDLVEPNPAGFARLSKWFEGSAHSGGSVECHNLGLEELPGNHEYDIVLCEGLIPGLSDNDPFTRRLAKRVKKGGVLVVTCSDAVSAFYETLRRYLARLIASAAEMTAEPSEARRLVPLLSEAFGAHLSSLGGISRPVDDWVWDNLLNPAASSQASSHEFSIDKCFSILGDEFYFMGSSPIFMDNWTWYKELPSSPRQFNEAFHKSFLAQRHNLLHYKETSGLREGPSRQLYEVCKTFSERVEALHPEARKAWTKEEIIGDVAQVAAVKRLASECELPIAAGALEEFVDLLAPGRIPSVQSIADMRKFGSAFGRGQQYVSMIRA